MPECKHSAVEVEWALNHDLCPLCLQAEVERLREFAKMQFGMPSKITQQESMDIVKDLEGASNGC